MNAVDRISSSICSQYPLPADSYSPKRGLSPSSDTLVRLGEQGRITSSIKSLFHQFLRLLFSIAPCFRFCFTEPKEIRFVRFEKELIALSKEFEREEKNQRKAIPKLQKWWEGRFHQLEPALQKKILLLELECHAPIEEKDKRDWAEKHYDDQQFQLQARNFIVSLKSETVMGKRRNPIDKLPRLLQTLAKKYKEAASKAAV